MNYSIILYILFAIIIIWRMFRGFSNGFAKELCTTVSIVIAVITGKIIYKSYLAFLAAQYGQIISSVLLLGVVVFVYKVLGLVLNTLKIFTKLPVIKGIDRLFGIAIGGIEGLVIIYFVINLLKLVFL